MQYPNKNRPVFQPQPPPQQPALPENANRKRLMFILVGFVVLIIVGLIVFIGRSNKTKIGTGQYYDPGSGETVSNPANKTPEAFGPDSSQPLYLGFSKLLDFGITQDELNGIKLAFERYPYKDTKPASEISIYVSSIVTAPYDKDTDTKGTISFTVLLNRKDKYYASIDYFDLTTIRLSIKENSTSSKILYDSGNITPEDVINENAGD